MRHINPDGSEGAELIDSEVINSFLPPELQVINSKISNSTIRGFGRVTSSTLTDSFVECEERLSIEDCNITRSKLSLVNCSLISLEIRDLSKDQDWFLNQPYRVFKESGKLQGVTPIETSMERYIKVVVSGDEMKIMPMLAPSATASGDEDLELV